jgi:hypothetical protein
MRILSHIVWKALMFKAQRRVLQIFLDGFGLGEDSSAVNPLVEYDMTLGWPWVIAGQLRRSQPPFHLIPTDACLGVQGTPQSATGQTSLLSGTNAARLLGRHLHAFPNPPLREVLATHGIFARCRERGLSATFANGYSRAYWERHAEPKTRLRHSATTLSVLAGGFPFRTEEDYHAGQALFHDITNFTLRKKYPELIEITPQNAAARLVAISNRHDYTLFEYFLSDRLGHLGKNAPLDRPLRDLDNFVREVVAGLDPMSTTLLVTSDHGNLEHTGVRGHTQHSVPTLVYGCFPEAWLAEIRDLTDIVFFVGRLLFGETVDPCWGVNNRR